MASQTGTSSGSNGGSSAGGPGNASGVGSASAAAKKSRGYTNPALQAMGIPRLRIPSAKWSMFWLTIAGIGGMLYYDRHERKKIRQQWKDRVALLATKPMQPLEMPRTVTVYIAPPPGDYLDIALSHFRQYVKPILVAAAVDYEVRSENRQGEIRSVVATEIRNHRRKLLGENLDENRDELEAQIHDRLIKDQTGGVICIGRGAYKEYINGLHEGWLGPLHKPQDDETPDFTSSDNIEPSGENSGESETSAEPSVIPSQSSPAEADTFKDANAQPKVNTLDNISSPTDDSAISFPDREEDLREILGEAKPEDSEIAQNDEETAKPEEKKKKKPPVPKPYLTLGQYEQLNGPPELDLAGPNDISQPIAAIPHRHILGFLNTPLRTYRFFTRRFLADEIGGMTAAVIFANTRDYDIRKDPDANIEEESEWPKKWKATGIENKSEWVSDFKVDERVVSKLRVYELPDDNQFEETM